MMKMQKAMPNTFQIRSMILMIIILWGATMETTNNIIKNQAHNLMKPEHKRQNANL